MGSFFKIYFSLFCSCLFLLIVHRWCAHFFLCIAFAECYKIRQSMVNFRMIKACNICKTPHVLCPFARHIIAMRQCFGMENEALNLHVSGFRWLLVIPKYCGFSMTGIFVIPMITASGPPSEEDGVLLPLEIWWRGLAESSSLLITEEGPEKKKKIIMPFSGISYTINIVYCI